MLNSVGRFYPISTRPVEVWVEVGQRSIVEHEGAERGDRLDKTLPLEQVQQLRYGHRLADDVLLLLVDDGHGGPGVEIDDAEDEDIRMLRLDVETVPTPPLGSPSRST